jgi:oxygen-independent coproporphyrinogen-3 oxidase
MAGIYVHIPFCKQACHYCNFHFSTSLRLKNDFLTSLLKEVQLQRDYLLGEEIKTIYFGGGTPSIIGAEAIGSVLEGLKAHFRISSNAEITLEANPDDISKENLLRWKGAGINRLSIGVQSFFPEDLEWMNRAHTAGQSDDSIKLAHDAGFDNITIDLIYGVPGLSDDRWRKNVDKTIQLGIPHISCYALTVEKGTALENMIGKKKAAPVNAEDQARQFLLLMDWLAQEGYEHYEISSFAKPGLRSRHNSSYWSGEKYLGLGPSAHSFNGESRQWNISNNALYVQSIQNGLIPFEKELLSNIQQLNEYIMTSLRTREGLSFAVIRDRYGDQIASALKESGSRFIGRGHLEERDNHFILTKEGKLFADAIAAEMFVEEGIRNGDVFY